MINPETENIVTPTVAAKHPLFRKDGRAASVRKVYRMFETGAKDIDGKLVQLESVKTTSGKVTSNEAIVRFFATLNKHPVTPSRSTRSRHQRATAELQLSGLI